MSSSIRGSEETKRALEAGKQDGETYDELLSRLARTEKDIEELGGWLDTDKADDLVEHVARALDHRRRHPGEVRDVDGGEPLLPTKHLPRANHDGNPGD